MAENAPITCPECKKKFKAKGDLVGKKIKCPLCTKAFVVMAEKKEEPAPAGGDADEGPDPYGVTALDIAPRCPNCAQEMEDEKAFICLHCGYNSMTREVGKTEKLISHTANERFRYLLPGIIGVATAYLFIAGLTLFCTVVPNMVYKTKLGFLDHESLRMWFTIIALGYIWGIGMFSYKRLIVEPTPPMKKKEG